MSMWEALAELSHRARLVARGGTPAPPGLFPSTGTGRRALPDDPWQTPQIAVRDLLEAMSPLPLALKRIPLRGADRFREVADEIDRLPDEALVRIFHATDPQTARQMLETGVIAGQKPASLVDDFAPGRGLGPGLYVGDSPAAVEGYGRDILSLLVPKSRISASQEARQLGYSTPGLALTNPQTGAVVMGDIPPTRLSRWGGSPYDRPPLEADVPGRRGPAQGAYPQVLADPPERQVEGFRAHRIFERGPRAGAIYPVMIGKENLETSLSQQIPQGEWLKSQLIPFVMAPRRGWHAGELPYGPQFNVGGREPGQRFGRFQPDDVVYSRVLLGADDNISGYRGMDNRGTVFDERTRLPFDPTELPEGGFYTYRPSGYEMPWLVSDKVRHERLLTDEEIAQIFRSRGLEPPPRRASQPVTERRLRALGLDQWLSPGGSR